MAFCKFYGYIQNFSKLICLVLNFLNSSLNSIFWVTFIGIGNKVTVIIVLILSQAVRCSPGELSSGNIDLSTIPERVRNWNGVFVQLSSSQHLVLCFTDSWYLVYAGRINRTHPFFKYVKLAPCSLDFLSLMALIKAFLDPIPPILIFSCFIRNYNKINKLK